jgi:hypothetical protein
LQRNPPVPAAGSQIVSERALEDHAEHAGLDAKFFQAVAVLILQRRAIEWQ